MSLPDKSNTVTSEVFEVLLFLTVAGMLATLCLSVGYLFSLIVVVLLRLPEWLIHAGAWSFLLVFRELWCNHLRVS